MRALAGLLALSLSASAQQTWMHESFENGLAGWTASGRWNAESATDVCGSGETPFPDGTGVAYYGIDGQCTFETGSTNSGSLQWNGWVDLPSTPGSITLRFWSRSHTEHCWQNWDIHRVFVVLENGAITPLQYCDGSLHVFDEPWHERRFDLTSWASQRVSIRFSFETGDAGKNSLLGWMLDDVTIESEPGVRVCPSNGIVSGCPCTTPPPPPPPQVQATAVAGGCRNSTNQSAVLVSSGLPRVAADSLTIAARNMPPNAACILAQHTASAPTVVFGDGLRCVGGTLRRMGALVAVNGFASWPPPGSEPLSVRGLVPAAGSQRWYHVYYRDVMPYCTASNFNVTDVQRITWAP